MKDIEDKYNSANENIMEKKEWEKNFVHLKEFVNDKEKQILKERKYIIINFKIKCNFSQEGIKIYIKNQ